LQEKREEQGREEAVEEGGGDRNGIVTARAEHATSSSLACVMPASRATRLESCASSIGTGQIFSTFTKKYLWSNAKWCFGWPHKKVKVRSVFPQV